MSHLDHQCFSNIKSKIHYKFLSRNISVSTISFKVFFKGCIEIAFKIDNFYHVFYVTDIRNVNFETILGFEFINKHSLTISTAFNSILIKNKHISFHIQKQSSTSYYLNSLYTNDNITSHILLMCTMCLFIKILCQLTQMMVQ